VVTLPRSEFLDQSHIRTVCTRVQFAADACPSGAIYGHAVAKTPLLDEELKGPVYLRSSDNKLPDLVADLHGIIDVEVSGRIDSIRAGSGPPSNRSQTHRWRASRSPCKAAGKASWSTAETSAPVPIA
jgi:hypothetical protein